MITFEDGMDARCRSASKPTVAKFRIYEGKYVYVVIGTEYGYLHTTGGAVRIWNSYSGARKAAKNYQPF